MFSYLFLDFRIFTSLVTFRRAVIFRKTFLASLPAAAARRFRDGCCYDLAIISDRKIELETFRSNQGFVP